MVEVLIGVALFVMILFVVVMGYRNVEEARKQREQKSPEQALRAPEPHFFGRGEAVRLQHDRLRALGGATDSEVDRLVTRVEEFLRDESVAAEEFLTEPSRDSLHARVRGSPWTN